MPALFLIFLQTFYLDFFGIGIDEGLSRFHRGLDARIVPAHDLVVFIAFVRPNNHAVCVFFTDFKHFAPTDGVDELFEIRAVGGRIILRPDVADDFFVGKALMDVVNGGFHVFFPLYQIGGSDVEHRIGIVADGGGGRTAFADLPPFGQDGFVVNVGAVVADAVQVFGGHAVVADDGARVFFSKDLVHPREVGSQFVGCQQLAVFFGKPAFYVGRNGAVAFAARLFGQFADACFVEYAVFAFARRIGFDQLAFVNQEHFGEFVGSKVGFADIVHAVVDDEVFGMGGEGGQ